MNNKNGLRFISNNQNGFTLLELLIVGVLLVSITGIAGSTLIASLRGSTKSKITNEVSQNGNYALSVMTQDIVAASEVVEIGGNQGCINTAPEPNVSWGPGEEVILEKDNGDQVAFACSMHPSGVYSLRRVYVPIDTTMVSTETWLNDYSQVEVEAGSCSIICSQDENNEYAVPVLDISFRLKQKNSSTSSEDIASSTFRTSAALRNFRPF